jgi:uncharacterized protein
MGPETFGSEGVIWATTTIHVTDAAERELPYTLAYVDIDDGPRLLAHVEGGPALKAAVGERARLIGTTAHGDPKAELLR